MSRYKELKKEIEPKDSLITSMKLQVTCACVPVRAWLCLGASVFARVRLRACVCMRVCVGVNRTCNTRCCRQCELVQ